MCHYGKVSNFGLPYKSTRRCCCCVLFLTNSKQYSKEDKFVIIVIVLFMSKFRLKAMKWKMQLVLFTRRPHEDWAGSQKEKKKKTRTHQISISSVLNSIDSQDPKIKAKNSQQSREKQLEKHGQNRQDTDHGLCCKLGQSMLCVWPGHLWAPCVPHLSSCDSWWFTDRLSTLPLFFLLSVTVNKWTIPPVPL